jgi:hypothetical protein
MVSKHTQKNLLFIVSSVPPMADHRDGGPLIVKYWNVIVPEKAGIFK